MRVSSTTDHECKTLSLRTTTIIKQHTTYFPQDRSNGPRQVGQVSFL